MPRQNPPDSSPGHHPARLSLISRHLTPVLPVNTPYTVERLPDAIDASLSPKTQSRSLSISAEAKMCSQPQPPHPTLLIPGPIEFDDAVLQSMSHFR
jgi:alanine-glyoxylate transaminase/serine-glyoxylate transaminase/serine-pyruvate transaminase